MGTDPPALSNSGYARKNSGDHPAQIKPHTFGPPAVTFSSTASKEQGYSGGGDELHHRKSIHLTGYDRRPQPQSSRRGAASLNREEHLPQPRRRHWKSVRQRGRRVAQDILPR